MHLVFQGLKSSYLAFFSNLLLQHELCLVVGLESGLGWLAAKLHGISFFHVLVYTFRVFTEPSS